MAKHRLAALALLALGGCILLLPEQPDCTKTQSCNPGFVCDASLKVCVQASAGGSSSGGSSSGGTGTSSSGSSSGTSSGCIADLDRGCRSNSDCCSGNATCLNTSSGTICYVNSSGSSGLGDGGCQPDYLGTCTYNSDCCSGNCITGTCYPSADGGGGSSGASGYCHGSAPLDTTGWGTLGKYCGPEDGGVTCQGGQDCITYGAADSFPRCLKSCTSGGQAVCTGSSLCIALPLGSYCLPTCNLSGPGCADPYETCRPLSPNPQDLGICLPDCQDYDPSFCGHLGGHCDDSASVTGTLGRCYCSQDSDCAAGGHCFDPTGTGEASRVCAPLCDSYCTGAGHCCGTSTAGDYCDLTGY